MWRKQFPVGQVVTAEIADKYAQCISIAELDLCGDPRTPACGRLRCCSETVWTIIELVDPKGLGGGLKPLGSFIESNYVSCLALS